MLTVANMGSSRQNDTASRLLARGGEVFSLALMAHLHESKEPRRWNALTPDTLAAVEEIRAALTASPDPLKVEPVIRASMSPGPVVIPPPWCRALWEVPGLFCKIGEAFSAEELAFAFGPLPLSLSQKPGARALGIAAAAAALCRSLDGLHAVAAHLGEPDKTELLRRGHLAHSLAEPGRPSQIRRKLRRVIDEVIADG